MRTEKIPKESQPEYFHYFPDLAIPAQTERRASFGFIDLGMTLGLAVCLIRFFLALTNQKILLMLEEMILSNLMAAILFFVFILLIPAFFIIPIYLLRMHKQEKLFSSKSHCVDCGALGFPLKITAIQGMIIFVEIQTLNDPVCLEHGKLLYDEIQKHNLKKGWWSIFGIIRNPFVLQENHSNFSNFKKLFNQTVL